MGIFSLAFIQTSTIAPRAAVTQSADQAVASVKTKDGTTYYTDWQEAFVEATKKARSKVETTFCLEKNWISGSNDSFGSNSTAFEDGRFKIEDGTTITFDLNGLMLDRRALKSRSNGDLFRIKGGGKLTIIDSKPESTNYSTTIRGGVITGGNNGDKGGCITVDENGTLIMQGGSIVGCKTQGHGGAIYADEGSTVDIDNVKFISNYTLDSIDNCHGGAIYNDEGNVTIKNSRFEGNYSEDNGGAIYQNEGDLVLRKCVFVGNRANDDGGAIYTDSNYNVVISDVLMVGNSARLSGGAIYMNDGRLLVSDGVIRYNQADKEHGGGIYVDSQEGVSLSGIVVIKNNTESSGSPVASDVCLQSGVATDGEIYSAGLEEGSSVGVRFTGDGTGKAMDSVSYYQFNTGYYFVDDSSRHFTFDKQETKKETFAASVIEKGNGKRLIMYLAISSIAVLGALFVFMKRKEHGGEDA